VRRPRGFSLCLFASVVGCAGGGSLVEVDGTVPAEADALTVTVLQTRIIESQAFSLAGRPLPQTIGLTSAGKTKGDVIVIAQASVADSVVASGWITLRLGNSGSVHLAAACAGDGGCDCVRTTCAQLSATCGTVQDGCGGVLDCGACTGSDVCAPANVGQACGSGACMAHGCMGACGLNDDGCGGVIACTPCGS
jgi:hypothetical protein